MIYFDTGGIRDPHVNLAIEEHLLRNFRIESDIFLLYVNEPSVIIGRNQNVFEELNHDFVTDNHIHVVRRLSGGGTVYHDLGNLNFSYITDSEGQNIANFRNFTSPIIDALDRLGVKAELGKRNEILVDGYKVSGNAQYIAGKRMVSHGTLLYNTNLAQMEQALKVKRYFIKSKSIKSIPSPVANISDFLAQPAQIETFQKHLLKIVLNAQNQVTKHMLTDNDWQKVSKLVVDRYRTWEWNYGRSPDFTVQKQGYYSGTYFSITLLVQHGIITTTQIIGEINLPGALSKLRTILVGLPYDQGAISKALREMEISIN